jgi:hypothetical protein
MTLVTFRNIQEVEHVRQLVRKKGGRSSARQWIGLFRNISSTDMSDYDDDYYDYDYDAGLSGFCSFKKHGYQRSCESLASNQPFSRFDTDHELGCLFT